MHRAAADTPQPPLPTQTVTGTNVQDLLKGPKPTEFSDCMGSVGDLSHCAFLYDAKMHALLEQCENLGGHEAPATATAACGRALDLRPHFGHATAMLLANRAVAYWAQGDRQAALQDLTRAIRLFPRDADLYFNRGVLETLDQNASAAFGDYDRALRLNPHLVTALEHRARLFAAQHDLDAALKDCTKAVRLNPRVATLWSERGYIRLLRQEYRQALADENRAVSLDGKLASGYYYRAIAREALDDGEHAAADRETAMHLDPKLSHEPGSVQPP